MYIHLHYNDLKGTAHVFTKERQSFLWFGHKVEQTNIYDKITIVKKPKQFNRTISGL